MSSSVALGVDTELETNKAIVRSFVEAWNTRDLDRFDELMGDGAVLRIGGDVVPCDPAGTRAIAVEWTTAFPDWHFELEALSAEGDRGGRAPALPRHPSLARTRGLADRATRQQVLGGRPGP